MTDVKASAETVSYPVECDGWPSTLTVFATVTDDSSRVSVTLVYFYTEGSGGQHSMTMSPTRAGGHAATIDVGTEAAKEVLPNEGDLVFWVRAVDSAENVTTSDRRAVDIWWCGR